MTSETATAPAGSFRLPPPCMDRTAIRRGGSRGRGANPGFSWTSPEMGGINTKSTTGNVYHLIILDFSFALPY